MLDDYCLELTSVSRYPDTSHRKFVAYTTIDVSAHTNYLDLIVKEQNAGNGARQGAQIVRVNRALSTPENIKKQ